MINIFSSFQLIHLAFNCIMKGINSLILWLIHENWTYSFKVEMHMFYLIVSYSNFTSYYYFFFFSEQVGNSLIVRVVTVLGLCVHHYTRSDEPKFINNFRTIFLGLYIFCLLPLLPICTLLYKSSYATWILKAAHWFLIARRTTDIKAQALHD